MKIKLGYFSFLLLTWFININFAFSQENKEESMTIPKDNVERTVWIFNNLSKNNMKILPDYYHKDVRFDDPLGSLQGLEQLTAYYEMMYENVTEIKFEFHKEISDNNKYFFPWTMTYNSSKLNSGEAIVVSGGSHIEFDEQTGLVIYHRDYFDMGAMVYEFIPVLGYIIKTIKSRFHQE